MLDVEVMIENRNPRPDASGMEFDSLKEYITIAKKAINYFGKTYDSNVAIKMLNSEDVIANIAYHIMKADWVWTPEYVGKSGRKMTKYAYRNYCALRAIQGFMRRNKNNKKLYSLETNNYNSDDNLELKNVLSCSNSLDPVKILEAEEEEQGRRAKIQLLMRSAAVSPRQEECIKLHYLEQMNLSEVARSLGISREAVRQNVEKGMAALREYAAQ